MIASCIKHCQTDRVKDAEADSVSKLQDKDEKGIQMFVGRQGKKSPLGRPRNKGTE
jgi:hypothetical protein